LWQLCDVADKRVVDTHWHGAQLSVTAVRERSQTTYYEVSVTFMVVDIVQ